MIQETDVRPDVVRPTGPECPLVRDPEVAVRGTTRTLGAAMVSVITFNPGVVVDRQPHDRELTERIFVGLPLTGTLTIRQDGVEATVGEGDLISLDGSRPYRLVALEASTMVVVHIAHHRLGLVSERIRGLTAQLWSGTNGVYAMAADTLGCLARNLDELGAPDSTALGAVVTDLVSCLFADRLRMRSADPASCRQSLTLKILCHVRGRLGDVNQTPERVARHFGISLRYLQVLFAELGTSPAKWIRDERLNRLRDDLADPRLDHLTVSDLGEKWGIVGASQVSRLFRAAFGVTPSEFRRLRREAGIRESDRIPALI